METTINKIKITKQLKKQVLSAYLFSCKISMKFSNEKRNYIADFNEGHLGVIQDEYQSWVEETYMPLTESILILKPLSAITDEDIAEVAKIETTQKEFDLQTWENPNGLTVIKTYPKGKKPNDGWYLVKCIQAIELKLESYQYLLSKGYDMPQYLLVGKTLHESGLAVYE